MAFHPVQKDLSFQNIWCKAKMYLIPCSDILSDMKEVWNRKPVLSTKRTQTSVLNYYIWIWLDQDRSFDYWFKICKSDDILQNSALQWLRLQANWKLNWITSKIYRYFSFFTVSFAILWMHMQMHAMQAHSQALSFFLSCIASAYGL